VSRSTGQVIRPPVRSARGQGLLRRRLLPICCQDIATDPCIPTGCSGRITRSTEGKCVNLSGCRNGRTRLISVRSEVQLLPGPLAPHIPAARTRPASPHRCRGARASSRPRRARIPLTPMRGQAHLPRMQRPRSAPYREPAALPNGDGQDSVNPLIRTARQPLALGAILRQSGEGADDHDAPSRIPDRPSRRFSNAGDLRARLPDDHRLARGDL
jgi:hypothetical protein